MNVDKLNNIGNINVLVFGDYMVDKYIDGSVNRISPEAPVPVVSVSNKITKLGGAGNVINNIVSLGAKVRVLGCVGDDIDGKFIIDCFSNNNVDATYMKKYRELNTIVKTRIVSKNQQFLRLDEEVIENLPKDYYEFMNNNLDNIFNNINSLVISDYGKGAVSYDIAQLLIKTAKSKNIPVVIDPKGSDYSKYSGATLCTPNVKELSVVTGKNVKTEDEVLEAGKELCKKINLDYLVLTRSEKGISLFKNGEDKKEDFPALKKDVIDVTGAGDTVVATISVLLPLNFSMQDICKISNISASIVVSKFGASTVSLNELFSNIYNTGKYKLIDLRTAKYIAEELRSKNKKIVFTNGCFDLFHVGHLYSFEKAREFGDILIVAVNTDKSVKRNKGDLRPIINENDRVKIISELECVDYVILMDDDNPVNIIKEIKPDVSIKGIDWKDKDVIEKPVIESYGGRLEFIELEKDKSTTNIIQKILKVYK